MMFSIAQSGSAVIWPGRASAHGGSWQEVRRLLLMVAVSLMFLACRSSIALPPNSDQPSVADLQAISRAIGFVEGQPRFGTLRIGVLHADNAAAQAQALETASALAGTPGPGTTVLEAVPFPANGELPPDMQAVIMMPSAAGAPSTLLAEIHSRRIVTVSTSPACRTHRQCILLIRTEPRVSITLDVNLAETSGIRFSPIFTMMVKRQ